MLKKRVIPKLLLRFKKIENDYKAILVTSFNYEFYKIIGDPISQAKIYEAQLADELLLVNIDSLPISESPYILDFIKKLSLSIFMPLTVGGGVHSINCFRKLLKSGADKVLVSTKAIEKPSFVKEASETFGAQCVVISVDYKIDEDNNYKVFYNKGKKNTFKDVGEWSKELENLGAGEIILSDIDRDGSGNGLNIELAKQISGIIKIPVIASGGCGLASHFIDCFKNTNVQGISAGNFFCNKDQNIFQTRAQIINNSIPLRKR